MGLGFRVSGLWFRVTVVGAWDVEVWFTVSGLVIRV